MDGYQEDLMFELDAGFGVYQEQEPDLADAKVTWYVAEQY